MDKRILIIGAGPAGLGAGLALHDLGYENWKIYEKEDYVGGLSASFKDEKGFTWDLGGHVLFSNNEAFNTIFERIMDGEYIEHEREAWIRYKGSWVPYPFQNNLKYLPLREQLSCLTGLVRARFRSGRRLSANFEEWLINTFGKGICSAFMLPYNRKIWCYPLDKMGYQWITQRVSVPSSWRLAKNLALRKDDIDWGPNNTFKFPLKEGTGNIFKRMAEKIMVNIEFRKEVIAIRAGQKEITISGGKEDRYDLLVNTMPLDELICALDEKSAALSNAAKGLKSNQVTVVGVGIEKPNPATRCWMYFPDPAVPFYRVTNFSHYSPFNVPGGKVHKFSSLICETSHMGDRREDEIAEMTLASLLSEGFLEKGEEPLSIFIKTLPKAYPIPTKDRDSRLSSIQTYLINNDIYSIGRFGTWKYEIGNMDHAVTMGYMLCKKLVNELG
ncbi:MAG: FAD-dependent oxidoreductase [Actinobacteria bacterium]|nr:FAD-dependent oxidoreductase [Actinomycetota bacterium]